MVELECLNEIKGELFGKGSDDKKKKMSGDEEKKQGESTTASSQHYPDSVRKLDTSSTVEQVQHGLDIGREQLKDPGDIDYQKVRIDQSARTSKK